MPILFDSNLHPSAKLVKSGGSDVDSTQNRFKIPFGPIVHSEVEGQVAKH